MPIINGQYRRPQLRNSGVNYRYGWFFVTFQVAKNKTELGAIVGEKCVLNPLGEAVEALIVTLGKYNPEVYVDSHVVMPNHVHLILKIEDRPDNDEHHLGKIMRKLKSLAAREYRLLKEQGLAPDIGSSLWQENYWEKIITSHDQLEKTRRYIADNPKNWSVDRFGPVTSHSLGNLELLNEPFEAFVASQDAPTSDGTGLIPRLISGSGGVAPPISGCGAVAPREWAGRDGPAPQDKPPIISTFTSHQEREALRRILAKGQQFIAIYPGGIPAVPPPQIAAAVENGTALLLSPVPSGTGVNKQRAVWCNEYAIRHASRIWCGHITPGGTLQSILKGAGASPPPDLGERGRRPRLISESGAVVPRPPHPTNSQGHST